MAGKRHSGGEIVTWNMPDYHFMVLICSCSRTEKGSSSQVKEKEGAGVKKEKERERGVEKKGEKGTPLGSKYGTCQLIPFVRARRKSCGLEAVTQV